jgi:Protein of unknown function (DUF2958)
MGETIEERYARAKREKAAYVLALQPRRGWKFVPHESCWVADCGLWVWVGNDNEGGEMKLLTKANRQALPPLYSQDGKGMDAVAHVKFFHPCSRYTLYVTEFDGEDTFFGYVLSPFGPDCDELGYSSLAEMSALRVMGLGIERDMHFNPQPLSEAVAEMHPSPGWTVVSGEGADGLDLVRALESRVTIFVSEDGSEGEIRYVTDEGGIVLDPGDSDSTLLNPGDPDYDARHDPRVNGTRD